MDVVKPALEGAGFTVAATSYGQYGIGPFLLPFAWRRRKAINRVVTDIKIARHVFAKKTGREPEWMSVIAHSFGTYVLFKIIEDEFDWRWKRIILCGSVLKESIPLEKYLTRFDTPILNEIGTQDYWPALAESIGWGYGSVGSTGFNRPPVESRWHNDVTHSEFLTKAFCDKWWVPFLRDGRIEKGDSPRALPAWIRLLSWLPLRWLVPAVLATCAVIGAIVSQLPFRYDTPLFPKDWDVATSTPEKVRMQAFSYLPNGNPPQFIVPTHWIRMTDAGVDYWIAKNEDGAFTRFEIRRRINKDNCLGTVVYMLDWFDNQVFIPDVDGGCVVRHLFSRMGGRDIWRDLGKINSWE
jgi:hypothetical protein